MAAWEHSPAAAVWTRRGRVGQVPATGGAWHGWLLLLDHTIIILVIVLHRFNGHSGCRIGDSWARRHYGRHSTAMSLSYSSAASSPRGEFAIELLSLLLVKVNEFLTLLQLAGAHILLLLDDVGSLADVMSDGHLLDTRARVLDCFPGLADTPWASLGAGACLIYLWTAIGARRHSHHCALAEGSPRIPTDI